MADLNRLSATEAGRRIRAREITSEELVRDCLERIDAREDNVRAFVHLDPDRALAQARACDAAAPAGPLHGVPVAIKDIMETADMPCAFGSPIYADHCPPRDAACVALLRAAGAVILGKTVTTEFATSTPGQTRNPHDLASTPGGSSSGSAAAVADMMVALATATQTAGSVIRPAAFCGVVGFKPSFGRIPRAGIKLLAEDLDTIGVLARTIDDVVLASAVMSGRERATYDGNLGGRLRIGVYDGRDWAEATSETLALLESAATALAGTHADVRAIALPPPLPETARAHEAVLARQIALSLAFERHAHGARLSPMLRAHIDAADTVDDRAYDDALATARGCRAALGDLFAAHDALLVPAALGEAPPGLESTGDPVLNRPWTLLHVPCLTLPVGVGPRGLPLGVQIVARPGADATTVAVGRRLVQALGLAL